jgi:hypothetical protein
MSGRAGRSGGPAASGPTIARLGEPSLANVLAAAGAGGLASAALAGLWIFTFRWSDPAVILAAAVFIALFAVAVPLWMTEVTIRRPGVTRAGLGTPGQLTRRTWWRTLAHRKGVTLEFEPGEQIAKSPRGVWCFRGEGFFMNMLFWQAGRLPQMLDKGGLAVDDEWTAWASEHPRRWAAWRYGFPTLAVCYLIAFVIAHFSDAGLVLALLIAPCYLGSMLAMPPLRWSTPETEEPSPRPTRLARKPIATRAGSGRSPRP